MFILVKVLHNQNIVLHLPTNQSHNIYSLTKSNIMNTSNFTIGQEVTFNNAYGVNVIQSIKGNTAVTLEKNTGFTYTKRLSSLKPYIQQKAYWNEQELAQPIHNHGDIVFCTLSSDGNGSKMVWDNIKKDCVTIDNLSN